jgi:hypothetical protein
MQLADRADWALMIAIHDALPLADASPANQWHPIKHARCSDGRLDPDQWFPVSADPGQACQEAAAAIAICTACQCAATA